jgi:hypothetical protein
VIKFKSDFGVYACPHVFDGSRPVLESVRDFDGDWQFLCGIEGCVQKGGPHHIGVGHLVQTDPSIDELTVLEPGMYASRSEKHLAWDIGQLDG